MSKVPKDDDPAELALRIALGQAPPIDRGVEQPRRPRNRKLELSAARSLVGRVLVDVRTTDAGALALTFANGETIEVDAVDAPGGPWLTIKVIGR
jgi:hypothetical protein